MSSQSAQPRSRMHSLASVKSIGGVVNGNGSSSAMSRIRRYSVQVMQIVRPLFASTAGTRH
ncbi:hypothetical protein RvY_06014 [Ramazzottius varieornatus]|uniref:Uncharacterized protein n=1 Tax=Ramazzottius varieornatus TaxID=947166 RepID=A0A1D1V2J7_RAMVA|nr:hypothetical protein RvY_06014 [Ramazzottius varieornatus]